MSLSDAAKAKRLDLLYADLPAIKCQRKCWEACGPIPSTLAEWQRMAEASGWTGPPVETQIMAGAFWAPGIEFGPATMLTCPLLTKGLCSVYAVRPIICRLWGLVKKMECPHGCKPSRWLTDQEAGYFLQRAMVISAS